MDLLKTLPETWSSPDGVLAILLLSGVLFSAFRRQSKLGPRLLWGGAVAYLVFVMTPLAEVVYARLEHPYPSMLHPDASIRTVVVLVGYADDLPFLSATDKPSGEAVCRISEGIRLYRELPGAKLILSGGGPLHRPDRPAADVTADFAIAIGVPKQDIVVEGLSTTTYENLLEVRKIVGSEPFILVTSSDHLRRATAVAHRLGMKPLPAPAAIWAARSYAADMSWLEWGWKLIEETGHSDVNRLSYLQRAHHEYLGYVWYWMLGRV